MIDTSKDAVERLLIGVTPGPWEAGDHGRVEAYRGFSDEDQADYWEAIADVETDADQRFIAAARKLVPALAAERDKWFEGAGAHHVAAMREARRADQHTARADAAEAEVARLTADLAKQMLADEMLRVLYDAEAAEVARLTAENERLSGLTVDEVERIINQTEPAQMSDRGDRIWTRRMACGIVAALQRKAGE